RRLLAYVEKEGAGQWLIAAVRHILEARQHRLPTAADRQRLQPRGVRRVIGEWEVSERVPVRLDPLHKHVVVFAGGVVAAAGPRLARDRFGEVVERARIRTRAEQRELLVRPRRIDLVPAGDSPL